MDLIAACRAWAGFDLDQLCASCNRPFYCAAGLPVCYGCRRSHARQSLLALLRARSVREPSTRPAGQAARVSPGCPQGCEPSAGAGVELARLDELRGLER